MFYEFFLEMAPPHRTQQDFTAWESSHKGGASSHNTYNVFFTPLQLEVEDWRLMAPAAWCSGYMVTADFTFYQVRWKGAVLWFKICFIYPHRYTWAGYEF